MAELNDAEMRWVLKTVKGARRSSQDRRTSPRFSFGFHQRFAPVLESRMPSMEMYRKMRCNNLSRGGLSFYWGRSPEFDELVIELGKAPDIKYLTAKVVSCAVVDLKLPEYLVRCSFTGRLT